MEIKSSVRISTIAKEIQDADRPNASCTIIVTTGESTKATYLMKSNGIREQREYGEVILDYEDIEGYYDISDGSHLHRITEGRNEKFYTIYLTRDNKMPLNRKYINLYLPWTPKPQSKSAISDAFERLEKSFEEYASLVFEEATARGTQRLTRRQCEKAAISKLTDKVL
jgi:hypothetical protein